MKKITDKNEALELIKKEPRIFLLCSDELRADKEVVSEFFKQNNYTLLGALRDNPEIVEIAVKQNGEALKYAGDDLRIAIRALQELTNN